jgi:hypothetical protein
MRTWPVRIRAVIITEAVIKKIPAVQNTFLTGS